MKASVAAFWASGTTKLIRTEAPPSLGQRSKLSISSSTVCSVRLGDFTHQHLRGARSACSALAYSLTERSWSWVERARRRDWCDGHISRQQLDSIVNPFLGGGKDVKKNPYKFYQSLLKSQAEFFLCFVGATQSLNWECVTFDCILILILRSSCLKCPVNTSPARMGMEILLMVQHAFSCWKPCSSRKTHLLCDCQILKHLHLYETRFLQLRPFNPPRLLHRPSIEIPGSVQVSRLKETRAPASPG